MENIVEDNMEYSTENRKKAKIQIKIIFVIRVLLWLVALLATVNWIIYSVKLYADGIVIPEQYSPLLRPVLYRGVIVAVLSIATSFALYALAKYIKKKNGMLY